MVTQKNFWNLHEIPLSAYAVTVLADSFKGIQVIEVRGSIGIQFDVTTSDSVSMQLFDNVVSHITKDCAEQKLTRINTKKCLTQKNTISNPFLTQVSGTASQRFVQLSLETL